jgi:monoamine oxidase
MHITSSKKTIAIIGAGVSGLQAARTILTHPSAAAYNVIIFEARNRIGGRVDTKRKWEVPLDYGLPPKSPITEFC